MKNSDGSTVVYLDYASGTPVSDEVKQTMESYWQDKFANSQAQHSPGREAGQAVAQAREKVAKTLEVAASEIVFTSGATESNSLAVLGAARAFRRRTESKPEVLLPGINHASIRDLSLADNIETTSLPLDDDGTIQTDGIKDLVSDSTALAAFGYVNSVVGTVQPVAEISTQLKQTETKDPYPLVHLDASQAGLYQPLQPDRLGVDMMTISSHKMYGPKGVGILWVRSGTPLAPIFISDKKELVGDYQALRGGTPSTPLIVGAAEAVAQAQANRQENTQRLRELRDYGLSQITDRFPDAEVNGSLDHRVANNISLTFPDTNHDFLVTKLNKAGLAVSASSACHDGGSPVIQALPADGDQAVRISLGLDSSRGDIDCLVGALEELVGQ